MAGIHATTDAAWIPAGTTHFYNAKKKKSNILLFNIFRFFFYPGPRKGDRADRDQFFKN